ncbi:MAG TPA: MarR family transcriptional regulator [Thermotogota bacterium]|nr:MarR family transcriptional regulator [Thermotogota bacterium]HPJ90154.1 MarR family transcriptional regulator [Thermotogota bacterium]HPR97004.1 MarR family transcriptional regulator [Thermotogota bacterium]
MDALNQLEWLFRTLGRMHQNILNQKEIENDLSDASHPIILFVLRNDMKNMIASQKEIADEIGISQSTVAISIKRMEKAGLLKKVQDEDDLRRNLITLTEKGISYTDKLHRIADEVDRGLFRGFSEEELGILKNYYSRMIDNLEGLGAKVPVNLSKKCEIKE